MFVTQNCELFWFVFNYVGVHRLELKEQMDGSVAIWAKYRKVGITIANLTLHLGSTAAEMGADADLAVA